MHEEIFVFKNEDCKDNRSVRLELEVIIFVDEKVWNKGYFAVIMSD